MKKLGAEFAVFSPRVAEKGNSNVLAHFSSIRVLTVLERKLILSSGADKQEKPQNQRPVVPKPSLRAGVLE